MLTFIILYVIIGFCFSKLTIWSDLKSGPMTKDERGLLYRWYGYFWPIGFMAILFWIIYYTLKRA